MKQKVLIIATLITVLLTGIVADAGAQGRRWHRGHAYGHRGHAYGHRYYRQHRVWIAPPPPVVVVGPRYGYRPHSHYYRHHPRYHRGPRYYGYHHPRYRRW